MLMYYTMSAVLVFRYIVSGFWLQMRLLIGLVITLLLLTFDLFAILVCTALNSQDLVKDIWPGT